MEDIAARRAAEWLLAEHRAGHRFETLRPPTAPATISDAYDIQDKYVALLRRDNGEPVGYKVGLTSAAMQAFCGIDHPIAGVVLASRVHRSGDKVLLQDFGRLGLEFEIAVRIKSDIPAAARTFTAEAIAPHIDGVCAAIELVDDRAADYANLDVRSLVADNSWNAGIVLSEFKYGLARSRARARPRRQGRRFDRRRVRTGYPRAPLQFGSVACYPTGLTWRDAEGRPGRDDGKHHENRLSDGERALSLRDRGIGLR